MKNVFIFFLFLFVLLPGANHHAHATAFKEKISFSTLLKPEKTQQVKISIANHNYLLIENFSSNTKNDYLNDSEEENEDIIRKHLLQARYFIAFCYAFVLDTNSDLLVEPLPFSRHLSRKNACKYITQRALLI